MLGSSTLSQLLVAAVLATSLSACDTVAPVISIDTLRATSYHEYELYTWNEALQLDFTNTRPSTDDNTVHMCIPAAFTKANQARDGYVIDGAFAINGTWANTNDINTSLGSGLVVGASGEVRFLATHSGASITPAFQDSLADVGGDFFQQFSVVLNGVPQNFRDKSLFVRRAIVEFEDGRIGMIESVKHASLSQFAVDLKEFGVKHAMYTDMGSFDEGWYRYAGQAIPIGRSKSQTALQTNWVVLRIGA